MDQAKVNDKQRLGRLERQLRQRRHSEATQAESWKHTSMQTQRSSNNHSQASASCGGVRLGLTRNAKHKVTRMAEMFVKVDRTELQDSRSRLMARQFRGRKVQARMDGKGGVGGDFSSQVTNAMIGSDEEMQQQKHVK